MKISCKMDDVHAGSSHDTAWLDQHESNGEGREGGGEARGCLCESRGVMLAGVMTRCCLVSTGQGLIVLVPHFALWKFKLLEAA